MHSFTKSLIVSVALIMTSQFALAKDMALLIANNGTSSGEQREIDRVKSAYEADGYEVMSGSDLNVNGLAKILREFEEASRDVDRIVIHYNGDLLRSKFNLRIKPTDIRSKTIVGFHYGAPTIDLLYELLAHRPGRSALIVATDHNGPLELIEHGPHIPQGVLVLTGKPSSLNPVIRNDFLQGVDAVSLNRKTGVSVAGYVSDIPMSGSGSTVNFNNTRSDDALVEMGVWREATQNGSRGALQNYIDRYPRGLFVGEARARLTALGPETPPEQLIEKSLNLTRNDRRTLQKNLTLLGFNTRGVDGIFGRGSRTAVANWQKSEGFRATGYLDRAQIRVLNAAASEKTAAEKAQRDRDDLAFWQNNGADGREAGLRTYLINFPDGLFASQAKAKLAEFDAQKQQNVNQNADLQAKENALGLNGQTRRLAEQRLAGLGYDVGRVDGAFDDKTRNAIRLFQDRAKLPVTGYLNERTVTLLVASIFR